MIRSSASLMAEDVTIRCRVRRSAEASKPNFGNAQEMTCTLRNWEACRDASRRSVSRGSSAKSMLSAPVHNGPELLLVPVPDYLTARDDSPVRRPLDRRRVSPAEESTDVVMYTIPSDDIMIVETNRESSSCRILLTTLSLGYFEFTLNRNGCDILIAFLKASLAPERVIETKSSFATVKSSSSSCLDMDVDALTAEKLRGRIEQETWPEKMSRRMNKVVHSLSELSGAFCDATCCRGSSSESEERDSPECNLEMDYGSPCRSSHDPMLKFCRMPSGLSVEPEPEKEATY